MMTWDWVVDVALVLGGMGAGALITFMLCVLLRSADERSVEEAMREIEALHAQRDCMRPGVVDVEEEP